MQHAIQPATLIGVPILDDAILATRDERGRVLVVIKRICEKFDVSIQSQLAKLKDCEWACVTKIITHDSSGRMQELAAIDLDSLPGWLFSISPNRVRPDLRDALVYYQKKAKDVLAAYFFGKPMETAPVVKQEPVSAGTAIIQIGHAIVALEGRVATVETKQDSLERKMDRLALGQERANAIAGIIETFADTIRSQRPQPVPRASKRKRLKALLTETPEAAYFSNAYLAEAVECSAPLAAVVRSELEAKGVIPHVDIRRCIDRRHVDVSNLIRKPETNGVM